MTAGNALRLVRGAVGNAVVWGMLWGGATLAVCTALKTVGIMDAQDTWREIFQMSARITLVGGLASAAFSAFIGLRYRGQRIANINWLRFGVGGGVVAGIFVPSLMFVGRMIAGDPFLPSSALVLNGLIAGAFGGVAAAASIKLAQRVSLSSAQTVPSIGHGDGGIARMASDSDVNIERHDAT